MSFFQRVGNAMARFMYGHGGGAAGTGGGARSGAGVSLGTDDQ